MPEIRILPTDEKRELTLTTNTTNRPPTLEAPLPKKSAWVLLTFLFLGLAIGLTVLAAVLSAPYLAAIAVIDGLAAVAFAVLSLRENV